MEIENPESPAKGDDDVGRNPFVVPQSHAQAIKISALRLLAMRVTTTPDVVLYNHARMRTDVYEEYIRLVDSLIRRHDSAAALYQLGLTPYAALHAAVEHQQAAHQALVHFVANYEPLVEAVPDDVNAGVMAVEEEQQQQQKRGRDEEVGLLACPDENRFAGVPCEVVALMLATEIGTSEGWIYPDRDLALIFSLMQTDTNLLRCILSGEGEPIWRELIAKYYFSDFRFVALDLLGLDFFTERYLGESPLLEIRRAAEAEYADAELLVTYMREQLRQQLQLHKRRDIFAVEKAIVASDAYALFMYMLLWDQRIETKTKTMMTPVIMTGDFRGFYKTVDIVDAVLHQNFKDWVSIGVQVFQHYPSTELLLVHSGYPPKEIRVATGITVTSLVHCAHYTDSYTHVSLCLILNGSHLLQLRFGVPSAYDVTHTYYGDVTAVCPQIRHCRSLTEATHSIGRKKGKVTSLKNDSYAYVRAMCTSVEPVVRRQATVTGAGGGGREPLNSIELIDFRQLIAHLDDTRNGGSGSGSSSSRKKPMVLALAANSFRGYVLGSCIVEVATASHPFLYVCYYSEGKLSVAVAAFVAPTKIGTFTSATLQQYDTPEDALHFLAYDYRRFSVFGSIGVPLRYELDRLTVRIVTPRGTLRKYLLRVNATSGQPTRIQAEGAGDMPVDGAYAITVLPVTGHVRVTVRCHIGARRNCNGEGGYGLYGTFTFLASADFLRTTYPVEVNRNGWSLQDPIVGVQVAPLMGVAPEAFTLQQDLLQGSEYVTRPGIRVLISSADADSLMLAYSTEPRRREELGFLGVPYCAYCGDVAPLEGLGVDEVDTGLVFCLEAACQHDF